MIILFTIGNGFSAPHTSFYPWSWLKLQSYEKVPNIHRGNEEEGASAYTTEYVCLFYQLMPPLSTLLLLLLSTSFLLLRCKEPEISDWFYCFFSFLLPLLSFPSFLFPSFLFFREFTHISYLNVIRKVLWGAKIVQEPPTINHDYVMQEERGLWELLKKIVRKRCFFVLY